MTCGATCVAVHGRHGRHGHGKGLVELTKRVVALGKRSAWQQVTGRAGLFWAAMGHPVQHQTSQIWMWRTPKMVRFRFWPGWCVKPTRRNCVMDEIYWTGDDNAMYERRIRPNWSFLARTINFWGPSDLDTKVQLHFKRSFSWKILGKCVFR